MSLSPATTMVPFTSVPVHPEESSMAISQSLVHKAYTALAGTLATVATQRLLTAGWRFVTGEEPPEPTDPEASNTAALLWALSSAVGLAVAQVVAARVGNRYLFEQTGHKPKPRRIQVQL